MLFLPVHAEPVSARVEGPRLRVWQFGAIAFILAVAAAASTTVTDTATSVGASAETSSASTTTAQGTVTTAAAVSVPPQPVDVFTTRSGSWRLFALPKQGDAAVYRMTLDQNPAFAREFACRPLSIKAAGKGTALDLLAVKLLGSDALVAQGACRVVQNGQPVAPRVEWIKSAVAARVLPAYRRERAWIGAMKQLARDRLRGAYDPKSLGPRPDAPTALPSSNSNFVGVTSAQGGEYESSRGFMHNADARVVDAALHDEVAAISAYWPEFEQYTFYSLAQPQGAAWSARNHITIDPQFPLEGDRGWEVAFHNNPHPGFDTAQEVTGWTRDVAHLENTGFVHFLATEDPIAALLVQRQAAYALASRFEYQRGGYVGTTQPADTKYEGNTDQERSIFNTLSALWKSRHVSRSINSMESTMFWSPTRSQAQADQVIAFYDIIASRVEAATPAQPADYAKKLSGTPFTTLGIGSFVFADGSTQKLQQTSAFESVQYGKEPLWLWSRNNHSLVRRWFTAYATGYVGRMGVIGGAMGVDGRTNVTGSTYPIGPTSVTAAGAVSAIPSFASTAGWAEWVASLPLKQSDARATFDGASIHTAMQMEGALLMARNAALPVPGLDAALTRIGQAKAATTSYRYASLQMHKHLGASL